MTAIFFTLLLLVLLWVLCRWMLSAPLIRTLSVAIDNWADSVQGKDAAELR